MLRHHGGNINAARRQYPNAPSPWIDLSTGVNPIPYPIGTIAPQAWNRLPDASDLVVLEQAAGAAYGAAPPTAIVASPGTQALLQWLPRVVPARRVGILGYTYGEHEKCWRAAGAEVTIVDAVAELTRFDVGVVVNPNNPDGRLVPAERLATTAESLAQAGGLLIVDEAFVDVLERRDGLVPLLPRAGAVVLRSFGKVYGLAGLRLGFAAASPEIAAVLRAAMGPWAVSGPAIEIGRQALMDTAWLESTLSWLGSAADQLDGLLLGAGFTIVGGTKLFRLASHHAASIWFERLAQCGILTRPFNGKPNWLRFGLPGTQTEWQRLEAALLSCATNMPSAQ